MRDKLGKPLIVGDLIAVSVCHEEYGGKQSSIDFYRIASLKTINSVSSPTCIELCDPKDIHGIHILDTLYQYDCHRILLVNAFSERILG